jgi:hypothetical protein
VMLYISPTCIPEMALASPPCWCLRRSWRVGELGLSRRPAGEGEAGAGEGDGAR